MIPLSWITSVAQNIKWKTALFLWGVGAYRFLSIFFLNKIHILLQITIDLECLLNRFSTNYFGQFSAFNLNDQSIWYYLVLFWYQRTHHNFAPCSSSPFGKNLILILKSRRENNLLKTTTSKTNQLNYQQSGNNRRQYDVIHQ